MKNNRLKPEFIKDAINQEKPVIVSILSGKGGVGKSVIAFNLSDLASKRGLKVVTIDTDWHFGNQHILGNIAPENSLGDILAYPDRASKAAYRINDNWQIIASPSAEENPGNFNKEQFRLFLKQIPELFKNCNLVVIDTPSGVLEIINETARVSNLNLMVINPELTSISDGYGLFKYLNGLGRSVLSGLVVNRVETEIDHQFIYNKFAYLAQKFLNNVPLDGGYLFDDRLVVDSIARQVPISELNPDSETVKNLEGLLAMLLNGGGYKGLITENKKKVDINPETAFADTRK